MTAKIKDGGLMVRAFFHQWIMRIAHKYHWHYAPPNYIQGGDKQLWCEWCGFRQTIKKDELSGISG